VGGLTLYPLDYRAALACSLIPPPLSHQRSLQSAFPRGETTGLLRSPSRSIRGLGRAFRPVVLHPRQGSIESLYLTTYRLVQASQHLRLVQAHGLYQHFTWIDHTPGCWPPTAVMLAVAVSARAFPADPEIEVTLSPRLRTSPLPVMPTEVADRWRNIG
jgi:hypothetical protein